jgi:GntR family transcriptional regulator
MPIWLDVNTRSGVPIYVQIVQQVRHAIEVGALQTGEQLPTVRQLASDLTIAPNTIVKAYNELQAMDLIDSRAGVGTVVAASTNGTLRKLLLEALFERLRNVVRDAASLGIEHDELVGRFRAEVESYYEQRRD